MHLKQKKKKKRTKKIMCIRNTRILSIERCGFKAADQKQIRGEIRGSRTQYKTNTKYDRILRSKSWLTRKFKYKFCMMDIKTNQK